MKRKILALICVAAMFCTLALSVATVSADWREYENINDIVDSAALVIVGNAVNEDITYFERDSGSPMPVTITSVEITEVIHGNARVGDVIDVIVMGHADPQPNEDGETSQSSIDGPFMEIGGNYLLFLVAWGETDYFQYINPSQGRFVIDSEGNIAENQFVASLDELRALIAGDPEPVTTPTATANPPATTVPGTTSAVSTAAPAAANPPTGVILALIPTLLAGGVALIVKKKRKTK